MNFEDFICAKHFQSDQEESIFITVSYFNSILAVHFSEKKMFHTA